MSNNEVTRINVSVNAETATALRDYQTRKSLTATEAVRRAIALLAFIDAASQRGESIYVEGAGGKLKEVMFLV